MDKKQMSDAEKERVGQTFQHGAENFTEEDLAKVMADEKTAETKGSMLGDQFENFKLLWSLLKDYYNDKYPNVPWKFIAAIGFAVAYLISPIDIIPDFLPFVGFIDDAAVFALVVAGFDSDIKVYKEWLKQNKE